MNPRDLNVDRADVGSDSRTEAPDATVVQVAADGSRKRKSGFDDEDIAEEGQSSTNNVCQVNMYPTSSEEDVAEKGHVLTNNVCQVNMDHSSEDHDNDTEREDKEDVDNVQPSALYATNSAIDYGPPPDGGVLAWTQVVMGFFVLFVTWGYMNSFGAFQAYYITVFPRRPAADISWIGAVQVCLTFLVGAFSGRLLDAGHFKATFITGAALHLLGVFMMSLSIDAYWRLMLTQGVLTGLGNGIIFTPTVALVATYFERKRALAIGIVTTGNSAGGLVYPAIVYGVLPKLGFAWTARILGFMNLSGLLMAAIFMKPWLPPRKAGPIIELAAFKEPTYVCYVAGLFMFVWGTYYTLYYIASFGLQVIGMPYTEAATLITIVNGVGLPFRVLVPMLALKIGPLNCLFIMGFATSVIAFSWLGVTDSTGLYIFSTIYGVATAGFQCLMPTGIVSITARLNKAGTRLGMAFSVASIAGLTGPPVGGAIEGAGGAGGPRAAQAWAAAVTMMGALLIGASRLCKTGLVARKMC